jgi:RHS repeat-associated protein
VLLKGDEYGDRRSYVYGNYIDEVLAMTDYTAQPDVDYFFGQDHLYSTVVLFDAAGAVAERYEYDAYGRVRIMDASYNSLTASSCGNTCLFTGRTLDTLAGGLKIYYYRARYYDPEAGRFLQRDPLGYVEIFNLYAYVSEMPVRYTDPLGLAYGVPDMPPGWAPPPGLVCPPPPKEGNWVDKIVEGWKKFKASVVFAK